MPITARTLVGQYATLEPLSGFHAPSLLEAADEDTFAHMPARPHTFDIDGFRAYIAQLNGNPGIYPHAVLDARTGTAVGVTAYYDVRPNHRGISIGYTWLTPARRGSPINPDMKRLLLTRAFETDLFGTGDIATGSAIRVQFKTDARNERSQRAMERLGFAREGTLRAHIVMPDGFLRDSVIYSVIASEWPEIKGRLETRIAELSAQKTPRA